MTTTSIEAHNYPISVQLDIEAGRFEPRQDGVERRVSDMEMMFHDKAAVASMAVKGDPLVYEISYYHFITDNSDMALGTSVIFPGKVGDEYFMTKGHFHERSDQPEIYHCVQGEGLLQMMTGEGEYFAAPWKPGTVTHIPPQFAHRVVNTGNVPLVFVSVFHVAAGHVYDLVTEKGFKYIILEKNGEAKQVLNPRWTE